MQRIYKDILISSCILLALDACFLTFNKDLFLNEIAQVQRVVLQINYVGVILSYFFFIAGLNYFILRSKRSVMEAFFLGLVIIGVYEGTNYAILKRWSPTLAIMDTLWGGILLALTTYFTYMLEPMF